MTTIVYHHCVITFYVWLEEISRGLLLFFQSCNLVGQEHAVYVETLITLGMNLPKLSFVSTG